MKPQERRWRQMNRYKEARLHAGLSQKAAAISLGVRPPSMSDWESGKTKPTHEHLVAMAALYGTTTDYLTGASDTKEKQPTAQSSELVENIISRIRDLDDPVLYRVSDFLASIRAGQETVLAESARQDSDDEPAV
jgi:transcriptional regulator with XRE-family HTH domain